MSPDGFNVKKDMNDLRCVNSNRGGVLDALGSVILAVALQVLLVGLWCNCLIIESNVELADIIELWPTPFNPTAIALVFTFMAFELFLMRYAPGPRCEAPLTTCFHLPVYRANGFACYIIIAIALVYFLLHDDHYGLAQSVFSYFGCILSTLNLGAVIVSALLMAKSIYNPCPGDCVSTGSIFTDFFWGGELHPRVWGWDIKQFLVHRFGLFTWQLLIVLMAFKQVQDFGWLSSSLMVSITLQTAHIFSTVMWEVEILCSEEFQDQPVGYFTCWWSLVWTPAVHALRTVILIQNPVFLSPSMSALLLTAGLFCIWYRYDSNRCRHDQRLAARRGGEYSAQSSGVLELGLCDLIAAALWSAPGAEFTTQWIVLLYPASVVLRLILSFSTLPLSSKQIS